jgi:hypothetical protein
MVAEYKHLSYPSRVVPIHALGALISDGLNPWLKAYGSAF